MSIRFSIIVPAYNEERFLPRLLRSIETARVLYGAEKVEIIVADNSSTDKTAEVARSCCCRVATVSERRIASARNGGAGIARGEIFCFIDADSQIHPQTFVKIDEVLQNPRVIGGSTGVWLERKSPGIFLVYCFLMIFVWLTNMDTGVVFCRRKDFLAVGGYDERLLFAEDVAFLLALKRRGRETGRKLVRLPAIKALGSTRKFDEYGDWHYFSFLYRLVIKYFSAPEGCREFADYWYKPRR